MIKTHALSEQSPNDKSFLTIGRGVSGIIWLEGGFAAVAEEGSGVKIGSKSMH